MKRVLVVFAAVFVIKLILGAWLPLSADEAYYWVWSHHLQLSYFDHPPFVSWLFLLGQPVEDFFSMARWPAIALAHAGLLFWIAILRPHFSDKQLLWWLILVSLAPLTGPGSLIVTPDLPLMFFWSASLFFFVRLLHTHKNYWAALLGLALGIGFSAKYTIVIFVPLALAVLFWQRIGWRRSLMWVAMALPAAVVGALPVLVWNIQNDFVSFTFQMNHGLGGTSWQPKWTILYVLGQIGLLFPTVFYFALKHVRQAPAWLSVFAWGPLLFFLATSFRGHVEANWPIAAYPAAIAVAVAATSRFRWARATAGVWSIALAIVLSEVAWQWLPIPEEKLKTKEMFQYQALIERAESLSPLYARTYQMASKMSFELKRPVYKLKGMNRVDFFDFRHEAIPQSNFYLAAKIGERLPMEYRQRYKIVSREAVDHQYEILEVRQR